MPLPRDDSGRLISCAPFDEAVSRVLATVRDSRRMLSVVQLAEATGLTARDTDEVCGDLEAAGFVIRLDHERRQKSLVMAS